MRFFEVFFVVVFVVGGFGEYGYGSFMFFLLFFMWWGKGIGFVIRFEFES